MYRGGGAQGSPYEMSIKWGLHIAGPNFGQPARTWSHRARISTIIGCSGADVCRDTKFGGPEPISYRELPLRPNPQLLFGQESATDAIFRSGAETKDPEATGVINRRQRSSAVSDLCDVSSGRVRSASPD